jgi:hypothetical protein
LISKGSTFAVFAGKALALIFNMKRSLIIFLLLSTPIISFSQRFGVEGSIGYSMFLKSYMGNNWIDGGQISFSALFIPKDSLFEINGGIAYQKEKDWNFIKIPIRASLNAGKQIKFIFGGGLCPNYVILNEKYYENNGVISTSDFTFDGIVFTGLSIRFTSSLTVKLTFEYEGSFTTLYKSFGGHHGYDYEKYKSLSVNLTLSYIFKNIKN